MPVERMLFPVSPRVRVPPPRTRMPPSTGSGWEQAGWCCPAAGKR